MLVDMKLKINMCRTLKFWIKNDLAPGTSRHRFSTFFILQSDKSLVQIKKTKSALNFCGKRHTIFAFKRKIEPLQGDA